MTEIKSTMDLVMERAARFGKATSEELEKGEAQKRGMHLAAEFLNGKIEKLSEVLAEEKAAVQMIIRQGMSAGLLRNIGLLRDDLAQDRNDRCFAGLLELSGSTGEVASICQEINQILGQYNQHRDQVRQQLEDQFRAQYEQLMAQQTGTQGEGMKIDPASQPKFREHLAKAEMELNVQYNQALEERKNMIKERF